MMMTTTCLLVLCVLLAASCASPNVSGIKFSINSRRNATGHWIAQVQLEHGADAMEAGPWDVDVDQTITKYGDSEGIVIAATITAPPRGSMSGLLKPPDDYKHLAGHGHYKLHRDPKTWLLARMICEDERTHLAVINSPREAMAVASLLGAGPKLWAFIGIHDLFTEGEYVTVFNETLQDAGYNIWFKGEPDGGSAQNCGMLNVNSQLGTNFCTEKLPFICEYDE